MRVLALIFGILLLIGVIWDTLETIVLPRAAVHRWGLTRAFYRITWAFWIAFSRRTQRENVLLSVYGPLSLLLLLVFWAIVLVIGFGLVHWGAHGRYASTDGGPTLVNLLYFSGTTFFTLGLGDIHPLTVLGRALTVLETGVGFGYLALVIGYLPVLYQSFSRREVSISMMDARAGAPPCAGEMLKRFHRHANMAVLEDELRVWERWAADLMESHISYPELGYYRSQHDGQSWIASLAVVLDACSFLLSSVEAAPRWQAHLTYAMARHAVVDLCLIYDTAPVPIEPDRLDWETFSVLSAMLERAGYVLRDPEDAYRHLTETRQSYEPYLNALARYLCFPIPDWLPAPDAEDNWRSSAWEKGGHF